MPWRTAWATRSAAGCIVESAGTWGHEGAPMEANAEAVLADFGADAAGFVGRELLDEHVIRADLVLTATRDHRAQVISMGHSAGLRTFTLKEFTRLVRAIDPATLPDARDGGRGRARPRAGARRRGAARLAAGAHRGGGRGLRPVRRPDHRSSAPSATRSTRRSTRW